MNNLLKKASAIILAIVIVCSCSMIVYAEMVYSYNDLYYTYITNELVSIYGVNDIVSSTAIPAYINTRKVVDIRNNAFYENTDLQSIDFSGASNLERIGSFSFSKSGLTGEVVIPESVNQIDVAAFENCSALESIVFDSTASKVPNQCCNYCTSLSSVTFSENVREIGGYAFTNCPGLNYVIIPKSVETISPVAFDPTIQLGVYYDTAAYHYAIDKGMSYVVLDPENIPVVPTEPVTEPTEAPTEPVTETPEPTQPVTEQPTEAVRLLLGDSDGDGMVDVTDATVIQRVLNYIDVSSYNENAADVDRSGEVEIIDATYIMRYSALVTVPYPIGEWI